MKFTLNDCLARVNQALNYPAVTYEDISYFFDQAISELNTSLRIGLPMVSEMVSENTFKLSDSENIVALELRDTTTPITHVSEIPTSSTGKYLYYCNDWTTRTFYKNFGTDSEPYWEPVVDLYGICGNDYYVAVALTKTTAAWSPSPLTNLKEFDLQDYMPVEWWTLFVIPYVCFKFALRNGDSGYPFTDDFSQGFQQLQTSYHVPNYVQLSTVAGKNAYKSLVAEHVSNLRHCVPTRAIYNSMKAGNSTMPVRGGFYENGGWGL